MNREPHDLPQDEPVAETAEKLRERLAHQIVTQWAAGRAERRWEPGPVASGPSNFSRAQVPWALDLAAAWSWRLLLIAAAVLGFAWLMAFFAVISVPIAISLLISALAIPAVRWLQRIRLPRPLAAGVVMLTGMALVALLLSFVGQQVAQGAQDLAASVVEGIDQIRAWLREGPLKMSDTQLSSYLDQMQKGIADSTQEGGVFTRVTEVGSAVGHGVAGFFIVLFSTYFFLADGDRIWSWLVRLAPRAGREHVDSSGRVAWISLTQFVRATVIVALFDAVGVMIGAVVLGVPFVMAIGVLVFLGAFIPMVGATVAGLVAILVALVDQGPLTALLMLGVVILVQQVEGHVLQPFLMGRFVSLHPLGVIVAIGCGVLVAGIVGALIAVPLAAAGNAVAQHLADHAHDDDDPGDAVRPDDDHFQRQPEIPDDDVVVGDHDEVADQRVDPEKGGGFSDD